MSVVQLHSNSPRLFSITELWDVSTSAHKAAVDLLDQQMYLLGCDVRCSQRNLLIDYGFHRTRGDSDDRGASRYDIKREKTLLQLWGSAFAYAEQGLGAITVKRDQFKVGVFKTSDSSLRQMTLAGLDQLSSLSSLGQLEMLFSRLFHWIADYEAWVLKTMGADYRRHCVEEHLTRPRSAVLAECLPHLWSQIADRHWQPFLAGCQNSQLQKTC